MAAASYAQSSFLGGEWAQGVQGRFDEPGYKTALNVCFNAIPTEQGNWTRRPGTQFAGFSRRGALGRLIGFNLVGTAPYDLELTPGFLRVWQGQSLALAEATASVTAISGANPAAITVGTARTWNTGDSVQLFIVPDTNYKLAAYVANRQFVVTKVDTTHFTLADQFGNTLDGSKFSLGTSTVTVAKILEIATPWPDVATINRVRISQSEGTVLMFCYQVATQTLTIGAGTPAFSLAATAFIDGPYLDPPTDGSSVQSSATSGSATLTFSSSRGFTSADVGRNIRLLSEPPNWVAGTSYVPGNKTKYNGAYYNCIVATSTTNPPDTTPASQALCPSAAQWCYGVVTSRSSNAIVVVTLANIPKPPGPTIVITPVQNPLLYTHDSSNPITTYQLGLYTGNGSVFPTCGTYHKGRFWFAGAVQNRVDSGVANNGVTCSPTYYDGTVADDNGLSLIFNFPEIMQVYWLQAVHNGVLVGTQTGEILIQASNLNDPITPTSVDANLVTRYGCANIEPVLVGYSNLIVQRYAKKLLDFTSDVFSGRYSATNVSLTGQHITIPGGISELRFQRELSPIAWMTVGTVGGWAGMSYKREGFYSSQAPLFNGWHRHALGSGRYPKSITVGVSLDGATDTLAMLTELPGNTDTTHHVEFLARLYQETDSKICAWQLDDAIVPVSAHVTSSGGVPTGVQLFGFWHGIGRTISAYIGGLDCGDYVVASDGSITVPFSGLFTAAYLNSLNGTYTCNQVTITSDDSQPPPLVNPTIMSMGTSGTVNGDPAVADWANRRFFQMQNVSGTGFIQSFNMDTGVLIATSPALASLSSQFAIDSHGNVFSVPDAGGAIVKYSGTTLVQIGSLTTGFSNTAHGNIQCVADSNGTNWIFLQDGGSYYLFNSDTMAAGTTGTLSSGKNSVIIAGAPNSGVCYAIDGAFDNDDTSFKLWKMTTAGVISTIATVHATDVDATWTDFGNFTQWPLTTDLTDGNLLVLCSTDNSVTNPYYIVKLNATTGAVMWTVAVAAPTRSNENGPSTNTRVQYGTFAYAEGGSGPTNVYCIDTIAGSILSTVSVAGITNNGSTDICSDDKTGDIFVSGNYNSATMGAPVALGSTPSTYTALWGRLDLASGAGVGTQNRLENSSVPGIIGFTYNSDGQLLRVQDPERSGARNGPSLGKKRRNHQVAFQFVNATTGSVQFGTKFPPQYTATFRKPGDAPYSVLDNFIGVYWNDVVDDYTYDGMIAWRIGRPYPLIVAAIEGFIQTQDK